MEGRARLVLEVVIPWNLKSAPKPHRVTQGGTTWGNDRECSCKWDHLGVNGQHVTKFKEGNYHLLRSYYMISMSYHFLILIMKTTLWHYLLFRNRETGGTPHLASNTARFHALSIPLTCQCGQIHETGSPVGGWGTRNLPWASVLYQALRVCVTLIISFTLPKHPEERVLALPFYRVGT